ncbi:DUF4012 domain-containing protein, partial [bacterium]|nr:DUF4012 domain-containing protein [bacterium]
MPKKPLVRVDVSWQTPKVVVFGGGSFLGKTFLSRLLTHELEVWIDSSQEDLPETIKSFSLQEDWQRQIPEKIDYVVDFKNCQEAGILAQKKKARLLTVLNLERENDFSFSGKIEDWRRVKTAFFYGPEEAAPQPLLNRILVQAVLNEKISLPLSQTGKVYPLYLGDASQFLEQALFSPLFPSEAVTLAGEETSWQEFLNFLEEKAQFTQGVKIEKSFSSPEINPEELEKQREIFRWQPTTSWQEGVEKTLQFFFQKKEKGEDLLIYLQQEEKKITIEKKEPPFFLEEETGEVVSHEEATEKEEISPFFWEEEKKSVKKRKKKKKKKRKKRKETVSEKPAAPLIIEDQWEEEPLSVEKEEKREKEKKEQKEILKWEKKEKKEGKKKRLKKGYFWGWLVVLFFVLTGSWWLVLGELFLGSYHLSRSWQSIKNHHWQEAKKSSLRAKKEFATSLVVLEKRPQRVFLCWARLGFQGAKVISQGGELFAVVNRLGKAVLAGGEWEDFPKEIQTKGEALIEDIALLRAEMKGAGTCLPKGWAKKITSKEKLLAEQQEVLEKGLKIAPFLDWLTGREQPRRFLVLLQNNMELRPTGGFIGSLAVLQFTDGQLIDFKVNDVYQADGQLKGHVEPPAPIKNILGEGGWYLRDSNWSPDFPVSAQRAAWFYRKETGQE